MRAARLFFRIRVIKLLIRSVFVTSGTFRLLFNEIEIVSPATNILPHFFKIYAGLQGCFLGFIQCVRRPAGTITAILTTVVKMSYSLFSNSP